MAQVQLNCCVLGWISPSVQTIAIPPMLIIKYIHTVAIYMCIDEYILAISTHLNWTMLDWRPQLYTEYSSRSLHPGSYSRTVIISLCSPTREFTPGVLSSSEQTAWPRGEPGSSSDCMDGSVRLCCASMFLQAEHRALFTAVCPFLTLAPFFYVNRLFMARDRQTWLTSESIFQVIIWLA